MLHTKAWQNGGLRLSIGAVGDFDEFYPEFTQNDFVSLPNYNLYLKLMIDGVVNKPFSATVLKR